MKEIFTTVLFHESKRGERFFLLSFGAFWLFAAAESCRCLEIFITYEKLNYSPCFCYRFLFTVCQPPELSLGFVGMTNGVLWL